MLKTRIWAFPQLSGHAGVRHYKSHGLLLPEQVALTDTDTEKLSSTRRCLSELRGPLSTTNAEINHRLIPGFADKL